MFLPTKAHTDEIVDGQYKIRLGNRVPKDAVNLAYAHIPPLNSLENILITDLSNTVLENTRNNQVQDIYTYPDQSLLLTTEDGRSEFPTEDILITNIFKNDTPLYYAHTLDYYHYDPNGPNEYGMYQGNGISIVDHFGNPIYKDYEIQLLPTTYKNLYKVIVFTSFDTDTKDSYFIVYNAISIDDNGQTSTKAGHKEKLNLHKSFTKVNDLASIVSLIKSDNSYPVYYQSQGSSPDYSKFYVSTPAIKDTRSPIHFRYRIGLEIDIKGQKYTYSSPWYSNEILNINSLTIEESHEYQNGNKQLTTITAEELMKEFVEDTQIRHVYAKKKYSVISDNDNVKIFTRLDGTSPIYGSTNKDTGFIQIPIKAKKSKLPKKEGGELSFKIRPLRANQNAINATMFVIDGSKSMKDLDSTGGFRQQFVKGVLGSISNYYRNSIANAIYVNDTIQLVQEEFTNDATLIYQAISSVLDDDGATKIVEGLTEAIAKINELSVLYDKNIVVITDGKYERLAAIESKIQEANNLGIAVSIITFNNYDVIKVIVDKYRGVCYNGASPQINTYIKYFAFEMGAVNESVSLTNNAIFAMTPLQNDLEVMSLNLQSVQIPDYILAEKDRFGLEIQLKANQTISIYIRDTGTNKFLPTSNGISIIPLYYLLIDKNYKVMARCESYQYEFHHTYAIRFNDNRTIRVLNPVEKDVKLSWYLRIKNGRFERYTLDEKSRPIVYSYTIPEYYRQGFSKKLGYPYIHINEEKPKVLNDHQVKVLHTPLYIYKDGDVIKNANVVVNNRSIKIKSWDSSNGIFELDGTIAENDDIKIEYEYEETTYVYRGFYDKESNRFWSLDLNPSAGHYVTIRDRYDKEIKELPSFSLINEVIYVYMLPSAKLSPVKFKINEALIRDVGSKYKIKTPALNSYDIIVKKKTGTTTFVTIPNSKDASVGSLQWKAISKDSVTEEIEILNGTESGEYFIDYAYISDSLRPIEEVKTSTLFHTFEKVDNPEAILLAKIHIRPNSNQPSIKLVDTRIRGGGLKPEITEAIMNEFEQESKFYWDIGYWDGEPYSENAVTVFRISRRILKQYGGRFTKSEVEEKINKHLGYGILPIIEFIEDSDELLQIPEGLQVEVLDVEDENAITVEQPTFQLSLEG